MTDREKVITAYICYNEKLPDKRCEKCPYGYEYLDQKGDNYFVWCNTERIMVDAIDLLKAQEPRLVTESDFNGADEYGYIPVWTEEKDGDMYWECIPKAAITDPDGIGVLRYWTSRPTKEQREAIPWN